MGKTFGTNNNYSGAIISIINSLSNSTIMGKDKWKLLRYNGSNEWFFKAYGKSRYSLIDSISDTVSITDGQATLSSAFTEASENDVIEYTDGITKQYAYIINKISNTDFDLATEREGSALPDDITDATLVGIWKWSGREIFVNFKKEEYGLSLHGATNFDSEADIYGQENASGRIDDSGTYRLPFIPMDSGQGSYFLIANGQRAIIGYKTGLDYSTYQFSEIGYVGLIEPFYSFRDYPYPLLIAGSSNYVCAPSDDNDNHHWFLRAAFNPSSNNYVCRLRNMDNDGWLSLGNRYRENHYQDIDQATGKCFFFPYSWIGHRDTGTSEIIDAKLAQGNNGLHPLFPVSAMEYQTSDNKYIPLGQLEGLYHSPSDETQLVNTEIGSRTYLIKNSNHYSAGTVSINSVYAGDV